MARPLVAYALCQYAGSTQREAAEIMGGCSGVDVSLQLKKEKKGSSINSSDCPDR
jgi:hypothetical protein